jgi:hypothetical protein
VAGEFIMKPYLMQRLGIAVRKELDRKQAAAESTVQTGFIDFYDFHVQRFVSEVMFFAIVSGSYPFSRSTHKPDEPSFQPIEEKRPEPDYRHRLRPPNPSAGIVVLPGAISGDEGSGIEGEGSKPAIVAEADLSGEQLSAEMDAGSAEAAGVIDDGQIADSTIETARDLPEE